jgi:thiol-disulfide isomerase/thioredoxin
MNTRVAGLAAAIVVVVIAVAALLLFQPDGGGGGSAGGPPITGEVQKFIPANAGRLGPDVEWTNGNGDARRLDDFSGKVVMVNFWASWCRPCLRELPSIDRLQAAMAGDDFTVVAINIDQEGLRVAEPFARQLNLSSLSLYLDPRSIVSRAMGVQGMPTTVLYDRKGRELGRLEGIAEWDTPEAQALLQYYIDETRGDT